MICDCWLVHTEHSRPLPDGKGGRVEEEHPDLRHLLLKTEQPKAESETTLLCGAKKVRDDGTSRRCVYYEFRSAYGFKLCRICELTILTGQADVEDIC